MPNALENWFEQAGYTRIENETNVFFNKTLYDLLQAHSKRSGGYRVCLFIGAEVLQGKSCSTVPNHWVVLNSDLSMDGNPVQSLFARHREVDSDENLAGKKLEFGMYTWGTDQFPVDSRLKPVSVARFLDDFYGYVAAK